MVASRSLDILTCGETMGLVVADPGPLELATHARLGIGGSESNVAIVARRLGRRSHWVSRVGDDAFGRAIERTLRAEGVGTTIIRDPDRSTGIMVKERRSRSLQRVTYYRALSAATQLRHDDLSDELIADARVLHLTGITPALSVGAREAIDRLVDRAVGLGTRVSFDINYRSALWTRSDAAEFLRTVIPRCDVLFGGIDEFAIVDPRVSTAPEAIDAMRTLGAREVVVKLGEDGAVGARGEQRASVPATPVDVVDTVGAGDAFVGGYLVALLDDLDLAQCLTLGAAVGAAACTVAGDWEGAPRLEELDELGGGERVSR